MSMTIKELAEMISRETMWAGFCIVAIACVRTLARRDYVRAVMETLVGSGICVLVGSPEKMMTVANFFCILVTGDPMI